jgi:hypothetical protein
MNEEEIHRSIELSNYFVIRPAILPIFRAIDYIYPEMIAPQTQDQPYNSKNAKAMSKEELRAYLHCNPALLRAG